MKAGLPLLIEANIARDRPSEVIAKYCNQEAIEAVTGFSSADRRVQACSEQQYMFYLGNTP